MKPGGVARPIDLNSILKNYNLTSKKFIEAMEHLGYEYEDLEMV